MRHLSILKGAASCLLALSFVACSDSDSTTKSVAGTVGDITLDRQTIGAYQPFTAQCAVASGSNLYDEKFYWEKVGRKTFRRSVTSMRRKMAFLLTICRA